MSSHEKAEGLPSASSCDGISLKGESNGKRASSYISITQVRPCPLVIVSGYVKFSIKTTWKIAAFGWAHNTVTTPSRALCSRDRVWEFCETMVSDPCPPGTSCAWYSQTFSAILALTELQSVHVA